MNIIKPNEPFSYNCERLKSAKREFERVKSIHEKSGFGENCRLVVGDGGHRFYDDIAWPVFDDFINK